MSPFTGKPAHLNPSSGPFSYTCPHLGMLDDPSTVTLFPSDANYCAYCRQPAIPNYAHQSTYCLSQNYVKCPIRAGTAPDRMPAKLRWHRYTGVDRAAFLKGAIGGAIALMLALFFILWMPGIISDALLTLAPTSASGGNWPTLTPSLTSIYTATPTSTSTDSPAPRRTSTRRASASATASATATETLAPTAAATRYRSPTATFTNTPPPPNPPAPTAVPTKRPNTAVPSATPPPPTATNTLPPPPPTNTRVPATELVPIDTPTPVPTVP